MNLSRRARVALGMKIARFADVVARCGRPHSHLLLVAPEKDAALQTAIRGARLLTVHQEHVGTHKDHAEVGFTADPHAQFLIFPRSLAPFAGRKIIGINYDLLASPPPQAAAAPRRASPTRPSSLARFKLPTIPSAAPARTRPEESAPAPKPAKSPVPARDPSPDAALVREVRRAVQELRDGKAVAAYERLQAALKAAEA